MKMSDVFKLPMLCEDGDGYIYSKDLRHSIMFDDSDTHMMDHKKAVAHAINNHDRLVNLETDRKNAISKMSKSWQHNADDNDDLLTRFVEMANRQFEERDRLREHLSNLIDDSIGLVEFKNNTLRGNIRSTDLDEPEWHDFQTIGEASIYLRSITNGETK